MKISLRNLIGVIKAEVPPKNPQDVEKKLRFFGGIIHHCRDNWAFGIIEVLCFNNQAIVFASSK
jgi:hypothetical protein